MTAENNTLNTGFNFSLPQNRSQSWSRLSHIYYFRWPDDASLNYPSLEKMGCCVPGMMRPWDNASLTVL
jgi:hypothetical protein